MKRSNSYKLWVVISREFNSKVKNKGFLISTFLVPIFMTVAIGFIIWMAMTQIGKEKVAIIDYTGEYTSLFEDNSHYQFIKADKDLSYYKNAGSKNKERITAILSIKEDLIKNPKAIELYSYKTASPDLSVYIEKTLSDYLTNKKLSQSGVENIQQIVNESQVNISLSSTSYKWDKGGETVRSSGILAGGLGYALSFFSFFFISVYGMMVMNAVMEEKKSRIMEVMVSSVKPYSLMMGKVIGIGLVGLFQIILWVLFSFILYIILSVVFIGNVIDFTALSHISQSNMNGLLMDIDVDSFGEIQNIVSMLADINWINLIFMSILYFIGGYLVYAALFAAVGSAFTEQDESNMLVTPIMILLMIAFYGGFGSIRNPEGPMAFWLSMIPFTSPVNMLVRIPYGVPVWQQTLSFALVIGAVIFTIWLAAKIYRVGILMHGKKPTLKELAKWISYK